MRICSSRALNNLLKIAYKTSLSGKHKDQRIGAVLVKGGAIIGKESNMSRPFGDFNRGFHAEERLIKRYISVAKGGTVVVIRSNKKGNLCTMSRPCDICLPLIRGGGNKKDNIFELE